MASFTTQVCDRCEAHYPLKSGAVGERPVHKIKMDLHGMLREYELCSACRQGLSDWFHKWMKETR